MKPVIEKVGKCVMELGEHIETIAPKINRGGCGIYAHAVGERLRQLGLLDLVSYKIQAPWWMVEDELVDLHDIQMHSTPVATAKWWNERGVSINHVYVCIEHNSKRWYIDSDSFDRTRPGNLYLGSMYGEHLDDLNRNPRVWNDEFDRSLIDRVRRIVNQHFDRLEEKLARGR